MVDELETGDHSAGWVILFFPAVWPSALTPSDGYIYLFQLPMAGVFVCQGVPVVSLFVCFVSAQNSESMYSWIGNILI